MQQHIRVPGPLSTRSSLIGPGRNATVAMRFAHAISERRGLRVGFRSMVPLRHPSIAPGNPTFAPPPAITCLTFRISVWINWQHGANASPASPTLSRAGVAWWRLSPSIGMRWAWRSGSQVVSGGTPIMPHVFLVAGPPGAPARSLHHPGRMLVVNGLATPSVSTAQHHAVLHAGVVDRARQEPVGRVLSLRASRLIAAVAPPLPILPSASRPRPATAGVTGRAPGLLGIPVPPLLQRAGAWQLQVARGKTPRMFAATAIYTPAVSRVRCGRDPNAQAFSVVNQPRPTGRGGVGSPRRGLGVLTRVDAARRGPERRFSRPPLTQAPDLPAITAGSLVLPLLRSRLMATGYGAAASTALRAPGRIVVGDTRASGDVTRSGLMRPAGAAPSASTAAGRRPNRPARSDPGGAAEHATLWPADMLHAAPGISIMSIVRPAMMVLVPPSGSRFSTRISAAARPYALAAAPAQHEGRRAGPSRPDAPRLGARSLPRRAAAVAHAATVPAAPASALGQSRPPALQHTLALPGRAGVPRFGTRRSWGISGTPSGPEIERGAGRPAHAMCRSRAPYLLPPAQHLPLAQQPWAAGRAVTAHILRSTLPRPFGGLMSVAQFRTGAGNLGEASAARHDATHATSRYATARQSERGLPSTPDDPPAVMHRTAEATPQMQRLIRRTAHGVAQLAPLSPAEPLRGAGHTGFIVRPAMPTLRAAIGMPPALAVATQRGSARPTVTPPTLVHAGGRGQGRGGGWEQPAASRSLDTIAEVTPREREARARPPARPPALPQPDIRAIADRVHDVLVERLRGERRARGM